MPKVKAQFGKTRSKWERKSKWETGDRQLPKETERFDFSSQREDQIANLTESRSLAKRIMALQKKWPYGTLPELIAIDWLERHGYVENSGYLYQTGLLGGRTPGGVVPDIVVFDGSRTWVWQIQGNYWHHRPERAALDAIQISVLRAATIRGRPVTGVVAIWERRLVDKRLREGVLYAAMAGQELGE